MTNIKHSDIVTGMSGSSKGITYALTRFGTVRKQRGYKLKPTLVSSSDQQQIFGSLAQSWRSLAQSVRDSWALLVPYFHPRDVFGREFNQSAFTLFMQFDGDFTAAQRAAGFPGAAFTPLDLLGCLLWLDASDGVVTTGSRVDLWLDKSPYARVLVPPSTTDAPRFSASYVSGLPMVFANTSGQRISSPSLGVYSAFTAFVKFSWSSASIEPYHNIFNLSNPSPYDQFIIQGGTLKGYFEPAGFMHLASVPMGSVQSAVVVITPTTITFYTSLGTFAFSNSAAAILYTAHLFSYTSASTFLGGINQFGSYDRAISPTEAAQLLGWLQSF